MNHLCAITLNSFVYLQEKGGVWVTSNQPVTERLRCMAVDPLEAERIYVGSHGQGLWRSRDRGQTWQQLDFPQPDVFSVAVSPADGALYAGCEPSMLFRSHDQGQNWHELPALRQLPSAPNWSFPPRPWTSHVRWIAPNPKDPDLLLAGIELGGLMRSIDGGQTWQDHRPGAQKDVHCLAWHPLDTTRAYQAGGGGAAWSEDQGDTWQAADQGRDRHYTWALATDPVDPDCWYISASPGPSYAHADHQQGITSAQARIYRWQEGGPWQPLTKGLPDPLESMPYALTTRETHIFAGLRDGRIFHSQDRGDSWQALPLRGQGPAHIVALTALPSADQGLV